MPITIQSQQFDYIVIKFIECHPYVFEAFQFEAIIAKQLKNVHCAPRARLQCCSTVYFLNRKKQGDKADYLSVPCSERQKKSGVSTTDV
jgi:hypothetical protein